MQISSQKLLLIMFLFMIPIMSIYAQDNQIIVTVSIKLVNQAGTPVEGLEVELSSENTEYLPLQKTSDEFGRTVFNMQIVELAKYTKVKVFKEKVILHNDSIIFNAANLVKIDDECQALPTITLKLSIPEDAKEIKNKIIEGLINQARKLITAQKSIENFELAIGFVSQANALNKKQQNPDEAVTKVVIELYEMYLQHLYAENKIKEGMDFLTKLKTELPEFTNQEVWQERFNLKTLKDDIKVKYETAISAIESGNVELAIKEFSELLKRKDEMIPYFQNICIAQLEAAKEMFVSKILEDALKAYEKGDYDTALKILSRIQQYTDTISPAALAIEEVVREKLGMNSRNETNPIIKTDFEKCELKSIGKNPQGYEEYVRSTDGMTVVLMPEREITIGDTLKKGYDDERPTKTLKLRPFYYDKYEISNAQYCMFLNAIKPRGLIVRLYDLDSQSSQIEYKNNVYQPKADKHEYPVQNLSWYGANAYSLWAWGHNWRDFEGADSLLPTSAMYECVSVCTPEEKYVYPWGNDEAVDKAVFNRGKIYQWDVIPTVKTKEFAQSVSYCGIYNLSGNVWEWIANFGSKHLYDIRDEEEQFLIEAAAKKHNKSYNIKLKEHIERFIKKNPDKAEKFKSILKKLDESIKNAKEDDLVEDYLVPDFNFPQSGEYEFDAKVYTNIDKDTREYRGGGFSTGKVKTLRATRRSWDYPRKMKHFIGFRTAIFAETQKTHKVDPDKIPVARFDPIAKGFEYLGKNKQGYREYKRPKDGMTMIEVPAGEFIMGSALVINAKPEHFVGLDMYLIDKYEVSNGQFAKFLEEYGSGRIKDGDNIDEPIIKETIWGFIKDKNGKWVMSGDKDMPVVGVTWFGAQEYAKWAKAELVSEAQWEKAARHTTNSIYAWGNELPDNERANFIETHSLRPMKVNSLEKGISPFGCFNMSGNVWEWCLDYYENEFYSSNDAKKLNPVNLKVKNPSGNSGDSISFFRVARGGGSNSKASNIRTYIREGLYESTSSQYLGFRCAYNGKEIVLEKKKGAIPEAPDSSDTPEDTEETPASLNTDRWNFAKFESNITYGGEIKNNFGVKLIKTRDDGIEFYLREKDGMQVVRIPGGYFKVGDLFNIGNHSERPGKFIWVPEFMMDLTEISNEQFCTFLNNIKASYSDVIKFYDYDNKNSEITHDGNNYVVRDYLNAKPVRYITFYGANAYSMWAWNQGYSNYDNNSCLPTEAMFEKATAYNWNLKRKHIFSFGDDISGQSNLSFNKDIICDVNLVNDDKSYLDILHLTDNVSEWCVDAYSNETCGKLHQLSNEIPQREHMMDYSSLGRVVKGASFKEKNLRNLRCSYRFSMKEMISADNVGFRCAITTGYFTSPTKMEAETEIDLSKLIEKEIEIKAIAQNYKECKRFRRIKDNMLMVQIDEGKYNINTNNPDELKTIEFNKFLMDETEVTVSMYCDFLNEYQSAFVKDGIHKRKMMFIEDSHSQITAIRTVETGTIKYFPRKGWEKRPVSDISWFGAYEYAKWVGCDLPTEVQFEAAARGDSDNKYPWGNIDPTYRHACFKIANRMMIPSKVGVYRMGNSPFGIKDLAGNIWEWCIDYYHKERPSFENTKYPCDLRYSDKRVIKGGCYNSNAEAIKIATRRGIEANFVYSLVGFRCVYNFPNEIATNVEKTEVR